jgi:flagellar biosynthetic protein FliR
MAGPEAIVLDGQMLFGMLAELMWAFLRIGAVLMVMPLIGARVVPRRVRFVLAVALSMAIAPLVPIAPMPEPLSAAWVAAVIAELATGIAIGLLLQLAFEATTIAGELIAQGMGLAFAQMANPLSGGSGPLMGQLLLILGGLLFLAADLHLALIQLLADSFRSLPSGQASSAVALAPVLLEFMGRVFMVGVQLALPLIVAMLVINLVFGVLSRTAPALNPLQVGLPATLFAGILLLIVVLPSFATPFLRLVGDALATADAWLR